MNPEIISEVPIDMVELSDTISKIKKRDETPSFRVTRTEEYLSSFVTLKKSESDELFNKIMKLDIPRLKDMHVKKIIDVMAASVNDLKILLQGYSITVSNENLKKIADLVKEYEKVK